MSSTHSKANKRSWVRQHFYDHPVVEGSNAHLYCAASSGKTKVYGKKCFDQGIAGLKDRERQEIAEGSRQQESSEEDLKNSCK